MQDIGFVHYWWRHDYQAAADWFERASQVPGAPWWLRSLAATTLAEGGDRRSSRMMWEAIRESAEIDWLRSDAERRLMQLDALDQIDALQRARRRFAAQRGRAARATGRALIRAGVFRGIPLDPTGTPYELDADGRVALSPTSPLFPLPDEPQRIGAPPLMTGVLAAVVVAALFGAVIGSFLNVCIYRLPLGQSIVWPASACPRCGRELSWYENIPVVSYVALARPLPHVPGADLDPLSDRRGADGA